MKILFIGNHTEKAQELRKFIENEYPEMLSEQNPDYIFVAGGDGSMLRAIHKEMSRNVPFFGIGLGTLNFILNDVDNIKELLNPSFSFESIESFGIEKTKSMEIKLIKNNGDEKIFQAVNEMVLGGTVMGYPTFKITSNDHTLNNYIIRTEKLCLSTPLGSTAYHYNNGGVIIPELNYPIYGLTSGTGTPSSKLNRFIKEQEIVFEIEYTRDPCFIFSDGIEKVLFEVGDKIIVKPGKKIKLAFLDKEAFQIKRLNIG